MCLTWRCSGKNATQLPLSCQIQGHFFQEGKKASQFVTFHRSFPMVPANGCFQQFCSVFCMFSIKENDLLYDAFTWLMKPDQ